MIKRIEASREKALAWFSSMAMEKEGVVIYCNSHYNQELGFEDMYLPGTYNAYHCLHLLKQKILNKKELARWFNSFQLDSGAYRMPSMKLEDLYYPSFDYDDFHITNYTMGILDSLDQKPGRSFEFMKAYNSIRKLDRWLGERDLSNPWAEGNNLVNLASFYIYEWENSKGLTRLGWRRLLQRLVDWHYHMQDPETGYWLEPGKTDLVAAMAGATHNYHIHYYLGLKVPYHEKIVDHCLTILDGVNSACLDIDVVDILTNMIRYGYRVEAIKSYLKKKLEDLLDSQNDDGGFYDVPHGTRVFDGWSVYKEPQGQSNAFATWFRMTTIGMISVTLYPETKHQWNFRRGIGIGYFDQGDFRSKPDIQRRVNIRPSRLWKGKRKAVIDLTPDRQCISVDDLITMTVDKFNAADLSVIEQRTVFGFRVLEQKGDFLIEIAQGKARVVEDVDPDIRITINIKHLQKIIEGKLMPVMAYGMKKLSIEGDISLALKFQSII